MARFVSLLLVAGFVTFEFFASYAAHAQIPDAIQGIWTAERDCSDGEFVMITGPTIAKLGDGLLIIFDDGEIKTYMLRARQARDGWTEVTVGYDDEVSFLKREGNRLARRAELPPKQTAPTEPPGQNQDGQAEPADASDFIIACETAPVRWQVLHGEAINFFLRQSALEPECDGSDLGRCLRALMDVADVTGNGELSPAEITRAVRIFIHFSSLIGFDGEREAEIDEADVLQSVAGAAVVGAGLARLLNLSADYDGSGELSLAEFTQDRVVTKPTPFDTEILTEVNKLLEDGLDGLGDLLGSFLGLADRLSRGKVPKPGK